MRAFLIAPCALAALMGASCASIADDQYFDTPVDAGPEASVPDAVVDVMPEPAPAPDAEPDPEPDPEADPGSAPTDDPGGGDEAPPGDTCVPITSGGECNMVEQCGCPPAHYCRWEQSDSCTIVEICYAALPGTGGHGATCTSSNDCAAGHSCLTTGDGTGFCYKWCRNVSDCPAGRTCEVTVEYTLVEPCAGTTPGPLSACSL